PQLVIERDSTGASVRDYTYGNQRIALESSAGSQYYTYDSIGSVTALTSADGSLAASYSYDPYGNNRASSTADNPFQYAGEYQDPTTGLYNLPARDYDPTTGRFNGLDPLSHPLTNSYTSSYIYALNDPLALVDPSGMGPVEPGNRCGSIWCWIQQDK